MNMILAIVTLDTICIRLDYFVIDNTISKNTTMDYTYVDVKYHKI